jgi:hypothetical protein
VESSDAQKDPELWVGLVELRRLPGCQLLIGSAGAFTNVMTWAASVEDFRKKAETLAESLDLFVACIEGEEPLAIRQARGCLTEELEELVYSAESNANAILYGKFHTYKFDQA